MDQINKLKIFQLVAQHQSFSRVAKLQNLPRSTVTQVIQQLEKDYDTLLFYRNTRHVSLTHEGQLFLNEVAEILDHLEHLHFFNERKKSASGKIRISVAAQLAHHFLLPQLSQFLQQYPDVKIVLNTQDQYLNLLEHDLDCAIRVGQVQHEFLVSRQVGKSALITLASPSYLQHFGHPQSLNDLKQHRAVAYQSEDRHKGMTTLDFAEQQVKLPYSLMVSESMSYVKAGLDGLGIIQIPAFDAVRYEQEGRLLRLFPEIQSIHVPITILMSERKYRPDYLQDFIEWLETQLKAAIRG